MSTIIFVAGRLSTSLEKLKVALEVNGYETAFLNDEAPLVNSNPVIGQTLFLL